VVIDAPDDLTDDRTGSARPFVLEPFRGLRFDPETVGDLGTVISPPYDVLDADTVRDLEAANRRNIVRLILSRHFERPYQAVRDRLRKWRKKGYLRADEVPGLYLYEYTADRTTVRGLIGLVGLRDATERVILPHEDVIADLVDDRTVLMRTTESNLEPILLVHRGTERLRRLIDAAAAAAPPVADFVALDASTHRLWAVTDPKTLAGVAGELAGTQALIADGHHRFAAYLRLQQEQAAPSAGSGRSPWDFGLAMLVDQHDHPLRVGPIHRSVAALTMADVQDACDEATDEASAGPGDERPDEFRRLPDREAAFAAQADGDDEQHTSFVLSDGRAWALLRTRRSRQVDAAILHETLLPSWGVADEQIGYHHSLDQALATIARQPGIVVAVRPPTVEQVIDSAAHGLPMPRKTTSFGPKPRMGLVMRDLRDS
jgi:uncharacterized protein (DUF1015 family)